ncbi:MAG TPA: Nif3-like dinuclear metal center hexameric protein [Mucilaginibacter sp.]|jgi:putative NIF3 family GTP cyclohydrolase 1 type 2|nr:Nif3-like dinuclear metal center hexameric protein [Mucilaginibacter sp.]
MKPENVTRRKFIYNVSTAVGAGAVLSVPMVSNAATFIKPAENYTVKQIMDMFIKDVPGGVLTNTVDTLKSGSPDMVVTGIVTSMFATIAVIHKAVDLGANFIIAHEPTFYNHADDTSWLKNDDVYQYKADLLKQHNIAVWRNHDYIHRHVPDLVTVGVLAQLDWQKYADHIAPHIVLTMPATTLKDLVGHTKTKLNIDKVRYIGNPEQSCSRILLMLGAPGGRRQIEAIVKVKPDVVICGEVQEWETPEYIRDAQAKGDKTSLVVLGHIASEEAGSQSLLKWLNEKVPGVKVTRVYCGNSLSFM